MAQSGFPTLRPGTRSPGSGCHLGNGGVFIVRGSVAPLRSMGTTWTSTFLPDAAHIDRRGLDLVTGLVAAVLVVVPLIVGQSLGSLNGAVFATLGALNLVLAMAARPRITRFPPLAAAAISNASALALGTLVGTTGLWEIPLVALGVGTSLVLASWAGFDSIGLVTAVMFAVGIGIPGGSGPAALDRFILALLGGAWAVVGIALLGPLLARRSLAARTASPPGEARDSPGVLHASPASSLHIRYAILVSITTAAGLAVALAFGLSRDYWIMLTVLVSLRATIATTFSTSFLRILGTTGGAAIALGITLSIPSPWVLTVLLFGFAVGLFATRWVNYGIYAVFLTPFIIILLNIAYPGDWQLAILRVVDTVIGGALAISAATLWWVGDRAQRTGPPVSLSRA